MIEEKAKIQIEYSGKIREDRGYSISISVDNSILENELVDLLRSCKRIAKFFKAYFKKL